MISAALKRELETRGVPADAVADFNEKATARRTAIISPFYQTFRLVLVVGCGHPVELYTTLRSLDYTLEGAVNQACLNCLDAQYKGAFSQASELGLPPVSGTPKQRAWAARIRVDAAEKYGVDHVIQLSWVHREARWWIETFRKSGHLGQLVETKTAFHHNYYIWASATIAKPGVSGDEEQRARSHKGLSLVYSWSGLMMEIALAGE